MGGVFGLFKIAIAGVFRQLLFGVEALDDVDRSTQHEVSLSGPDDGFLKESGVCEDLAGLLLVSFRTPGEDVVALRAVGSEE